MTIDVQTMAILTLVVAFCGMVFGGLALLIAAIVNRADIRDFITESIPRASRWRYWIWYIAWFVVGVAVANVTTLLRAEISYGRERGNRSKETFGRQSRTLTNMSTRQFGTVVSGR